MVRVVEQQRGSRRTPAVCARPGARAPAGSTRARDELCSIERRVQVERVSRSYELDVEPRVHRAIAAESAASPGLRHQVLRAPGVAAARAPAPDVPAPRARTPPRGEVRVTVVPVGAQANGRTTPPSLVHPPCRPRSRVLPLRRERAIQRKVTTSPCRSTPYRSPARVTALAASARRPTHPLSTCVSAIRRASRAIPRVDEDRRTAPELAQARDVTEDERAARRGCLEDREPKWLVPSRRREDRCGSHPAPELGTRQGSERLEASARGWRGRVWTRAVSGNVHWNRELARGLVEPLDVLRAVPHSPRREHERFLAPRPRRPRRSIPL